MRRCAVTAAAAVATAAATAVAWRRRRRALLGAALSRWIEKTALAPLGAGAFLPSGVAPRREDREGPARARVRRRGTPPPARSSAGSFGSGRGRRLDEITERRGAAAASRRSRSGSPDSPRDSSPTASGHRGRCRSARSPGCASPRAARARAGRSCARASRARSARPARAAASRGRRGSAARPSGSGSGRTRPRTACFTARRARRADFSVRLLRAAISERPARRGGSLAAGARRAASGALVHDDRPHASGPCRGRRAATRRRAVGPEPVLAAAPHRGEHVEERAALLGEPVLVARRPLLVAALREQALFDEAREAPREDRARHAERALEVVEAALPEAARSAAGSASTSRRPGRWCARSGRARGRSACASCDVTRASAASTRARTCLCHGVPATQSRSSEAVSSFGATPCTTRAPALVRVVERRARSAASRGRAGACR